MSIYVKVNWTFRSHLNNDDSLELYQVVLLFIDICCQQEIFHFKIYILLHFYNYDF